MGKGIDRGHGRVAPPDRPLADRMPKTLTGAELRFPRLELDLSQARLAAILGSNEQNVRRWEKAREHAIQGPADRVMRLLYDEYTGGDEISASYGRSPRRA